MKNASKDWSLIENGIDLENIDKNGNRFLIGNGYIGLRGVLEEFGKDQLVACTVNGLYDKCCDQWREPVNAPNAFNLKLRVNGTQLQTTPGEVVEHTQSLDLSRAIHSRRTTYRLASSETLTLEIERFLSADNIHLGVMSCRIQTTTECDLEVRTNITSDVWDINGPHLRDFTPNAQGTCQCLESSTTEKGIPVSVASDIAASSEWEIETESSQSAHVLRLTSEANKSYSICKYISIYNGEDTPDPTFQAMRAASHARDLGYEQIRTAHEKVWSDRWSRSDVVIKGDEESQFALRYSIYHLLIAAPTKNGLSIPARGLSGQVYKGAIFWDTEIFMLPFFNHTQPKLARRLVDYRFHTLDGARRKASDYGYRGAFYAWESQETGDDACTYFNVTDVITGRPMRTYFRDKQIHISADVAIAIWRHYEQSGEIEILTEGGAEVILECARFFYSYSNYKPDRERYELHDVVGPDEYHERVNNNAFTNAMARYTAQIAIKVSELLQRQQPAEWSRLAEKLSLGNELQSFSEFAEKLYQPEPDPETLIIEQFDGYHRLEDNRPESLKERLIKPNEYWGGGNGIATTTKVLKQADVVLMLHLFSSEYADEVKLANWEYYESRTEHGSSLPAPTYQRHSIKTNRPTAKVFRRLMKPSKKLRLRQSIWPAPPRIGKPH